MGLGRAAGLAPLSLGPEAVDDVVVGPLHASTGAVIARASAEAEGVNTAATRLRIDKDRVVIGRLDGRIFGYRLLLDANGPARTG